MQCRRSKMSLDGLFEQIFHYEKTAQERKNFLQELRQAVFSAEEKGNELEKSYIDLKNKLGQKICELSDKELIFKWLASQEIIFLEQQADLKNQLGQKTEEEKRVLKKLKEEKERFCTKISDFTKQFGPSNSGSVDRELTYTSRLAALLQEKDQLVSELHKVNARQDTVDKLLTDKEKLQKQLEKVVSENKKLTSSLCEELQKSSDLEDERQSVSNIPHTDPEFSCIQGQLATERQISVKLEEKCTVLQTQLHQLHQKIWQQQLKQQQQQKLSHPQQSCNKQLQFKPTKCTGQQHVSNEKSCSSEEVGNQPVLRNCHVSWQHSGKTGMSSEQLIDNKVTHRHNSQTQRQTSVGEKVGQTWKNNEGLSEASSYLKNRMTVSCSSQQNPQRMTVSCSSQQNSQKTDSCLDDGSDAMFNDSYDFSVEN